LLFNTLISKTSLFNTLHELRIDVRMLPGVVLLCHDFALIEIDQQFEEGELLSCFHRFDYDVYSGTTCRPVLGTWTFQERQHGLLGRFLEGDDAEVDILLLAEVRAYDGRSSRDLVWAEGIEGVGRHGGVKC
jgi:hypothetical protein